MSTSKQEWLDNTYLPAVGRTPERDVAFETSSGQPVEPFYAAEDREGGAPDFPGESPYTRGLQPTMYRGRLWTMRQYSGFGDAEESNRRYRYLFANGQTGLSVAFDLPPQMGRDPDHELARGEVGPVGVSSGSLYDMETLLASLPLD